MSALRQAVESSIDLDLLARQTQVPLHVSATHVMSGSARLFTGPAVTLDALMASACLPELFAAVEIDGEEYWDGGFAANPALEPLLADAIGATDMLIVQLTPFTVEDVGGSVGEVMRRVSDISFNACLRRDLRALSEIQDIARAESSRDARMRAIAGQSAPALTAARTRRAVGDQQGRYPLVGASGPARKGPCAGGALAGRAS